jgi:osmotically-inducible protein OsmY
MTVTSLVTLPARLGYEAARRSLDLAAGAGRLVGLGGSEEAPAKASPRRPRPPKPGMDDTTLTRKVETEIFRLSGVAKGKIDVNSARGVVWIRGEAKTPALIERVEAKAASIPEVKRVENLLHLPKTPAPTRTDTPARQRKTRGSSRRPPTRRRSAARGGNGASAAPAAAQTEEASLTRKVESQIFREGYAPKGSVSVSEADGVVRLSGLVRNADDVRELQRRALSVPGVKRVENELVLPETPAAAEPLPYDLADRGEGRQPAPLGASDEAPGAGTGGDARTTIP